MNRKARVYRKTELGSIPKDTLVWSEYRDAMPGFELDVQCYQGIDELRDGRGGWETHVEYLGGYDPVKDYGIEWRLWTARPTDEEMEKAKWADE